MREIYVPDIYFLFLFVHYFNLYVKVLILFDQTEWASEFVFLYFGNISNLELIDYTGIETKNQTRIDNNHFSRYASESKFKILAKFPHV